MEIRALRELLRYRQTVGTAHTAVAKRSQQLSERAKIKRGQVASAVVGLRGRRMLRALAQGEQDVTQRAEWAQGQLKNKKAARRRARAGRGTQGQRWVLAEFLPRVAGLEVALTRGAARRGEAVTAGADPFGPAAVEVLESIPGVGIGTAQPSVAEIGVDRERVPSAQHVARWAGGCPGNPESAGKRKRGQPTQGNTSVRTGLGEAAWAATRAKGTFLQAK